MQAPDANISDPERAIEEQPVFGPPWFWHATESGLQRIFVSYSRSEAPFVGALADRLEPMVAKGVQEDPGEGVLLWLDYRNMKPARDWEEEWQAAVDAADAVLVVVSKRSMRESEEVENEIGRAREQQKRVVLAIVEAAPLLEDLEGCEWVDTRGNFDAAARHLGMGLRGEGARGPSRPPPTSGLRAPVAVWLTALLAVPVALLSLAVAWTLIIPLVLVPLPVGLLRRKFNYSAVRTSLVALPWAIQVLSFFAEDIGEESGAVDASEQLTGVSVLLCLALYLAIRSRRVRRWMMPAAARPLSPKRIDSTRKPVAKRFAIDYKPQDVRYARPLEEALLGRDHQKTDQAHAQITLRLISRYHDRDESTKGRKILPVLIQDPDGQLPDRLRRTQWIDLRRGARPNELEALARSLDEPEKLLGVIGIPPPHDQLVMPSGVFALYLGFWAAVLGPLSALWFVGYAQVRYAPDPYIGGPIAFFILAAIVAATSWWATTVVRKREPRAPLRTLSVAVALGLLGLILMTSYAETPDDTGDSLVDSAAVALAFPTIWLPLSWAIFNNGIERWMPAPAEGSAPELPKWRSQVFRLLALVFACGIYWLPNFFE